MRRSLTLATVMCALCGANGVRADANAPGPKLRSARGDQISGARGASGVQPTGPWDAIPSQLGDIVETPMPSVAHRWVATAAGRGGRALSSGPSPSQGAGIAFGVILSIIILAILGVIMIRRRRRRQHWQPTWSDLKEVGRDIKRLTLQFAKCVRRKCREHSAARAESLRQEREAAEAAENVPKKKLPRRDVDEDVNPNSPDPDDGDSDGEPKKRMKKEKVQQRRHSTKEVGRRKSAGGDSGSDRDHDGHEGGGKQTAEPAPFVMVNGVRIDGDRSYTNYSRHRETCKHFKKGMRRAMSESPRSQRHKGMGSRQDSDLSHISVVVDNSQDEARTTKLKITGHSLKRLKHSLQAQFSGAAPKPPPLRSPLSPRSETGPPPRGSRLGSYDPFADSNPDDGEMRGRAHPFYHVDRGSDTSSAFQRIVPPPTLEEPVPVRFHAEIVPPHRNPSIMSALAQQQGEADPRRFLGPYVPISRLLPPAPAPPPVTALNVTHHVVTHGPVVHTQPPSPPPALSVRVPEVVGPTLYHWGHGVVGAGGRAKSEGPRKKKAKRKAHVRFSPDQPKYHKAGGLHSITAEADLDAMLPIYSV